jgi:hypothetical protein
MQIDSCMGLWLLELSWVWQGVRERIRFEYRLQDWS